MTPLWKNKTNNVNNKKITPSIAYDLFNAEAFLAQYENETPENTFNIMTGKGNSIEIKKDLEKGRNVFLVTPSTSYDSGLDKLCDYAEKQGYKIIHEHTSWNNLNWLSSVTDPTGVENLVKDIISVYGLQDELANLRASIVLKMALYMYMEKHAWNLRKSQEKTGFVNFYNQINFDATVSQLKTNGYYIDSLDKSSYEWIEPAQLILEKVASDEQFIPSYAEHLSNIIEQKHFIIYSYDALDLGNIQKIVLSQYLQILNNKSLWDKDTEGCSIYLGDFNQTKYNNIEAWIRLVKRYHKNIKLFISANDITKTKLLYGKDFTQILFNRADNIFCYESFLCIRSEDTKKLIRSITKNIHTFNKEIRFNDTDKYTEECKIIGQGKGLKEIRAGILNNPTGFVISRSPSKRCVDSKGRVGYTLAHTTLMPI